MQFWQFIGDLHPKLVQFPLVLLLAGLICDFAGLVFRSPAFNKSGKALSAAGTFFLLIAFICGIYAEIWAARAGIPEDPIEWHELFANIASWGFVVLMAWRLFLNETTRKSLTVYVLIGLGWYGFLVMTGYYGGQLVFNYGAAVIGARANDVLSLHDLNTLATRQTDENLRYSELMHHVAGWLTLALSGSLFVHALFPKKADKLKWVGPLLLLVGGISLFFFADLDLYRLFDPRQLRDREVQLHKTLAIILATVGAIGLWRIRGRHKLDNPTASRMATPSNVIAVMALIGGGMLFTHVHTVAPYANVAAGVYIAHIFMGVTALGIGAARLLQDAVPRYKKPFAVLFAVLMCTESVLLITYNEGLPWYIGYGSYNRWGVHLDGTRDPHAPIAPFGPIRAQLNFDPSTQRLDICVKDRYAETPVKVPTAKLTLLISRGYSEIGIPMTSDGGREPASHFSAVAPFLKNIAAFSARVALPIGSSMEMGYFDPWVSDLINPVPPNELARYQCPMHDGIISVNPGVCPICGMTLMPIRWTPPSYLHLPDYGMRLDATNAVAGKPVLLRLTPLYHGQLFRHLLVVHEHPMHLIIVSADLSTYNHVHPLPQPDGSLQLLYTFAAPGDYLLYADVTPVGQRAQIFRMPLTVHPADSRTELLVGSDPLEPSPSLAKPLPDDPTMTAQLIFQPRTPVAGIETHFIFRLMQNDRPVNDLRPFMGAMAHCVVISQDTQVFLHCHPEQLLSPTPDARAGPDIPFGTIFPKPGLYKIWGQFRRGNKMIVVDFVVPIKPSLLPPKVVRFLLDD
ncbi:MAG TPA: DUF2231 domain-containing protein [Tepidisphaeraceae bacterium]|jgi:uncharacterized membrane protein|nr:DUF2231 domain-containing protein [Tepidisphaeraceae bacterium]